MPLSHRIKDHTEVNDRQVRVHRRPGQDLLPFPGHRPLTGSVLHSFLQWTHAPCCFYTGAGFVDVSMPKARAALCGHAPDQ